MKLSFNNKFFCFLSVLGVVVGSANATRNLMLAETDGIENEYIVVTKECPIAESRGSNTSSQDMALAITQDIDAEPGFIYDTTICGFSTTMSYEDAETISERDDVDYVAQNVVFTASDVTWGIDRIDQRILPVDNTFTPFSDGSGVDAYIIDTGIYVDHEEFEGRAEWGHNAADNDNRDCNGHGTHVAGTVGGKEYGVAKNVHLIAVKVLTCQGSGSAAGVIAGIEWVAKEAKKRGKPSTANLSLGGGKYQPINEAVRKLHASGVVTVVAAGNSNADARNYSPASEPTVLTVGATTVYDRRSSFSNYGELLDIFAPGSSIKAAYIGGRTKTATLSGTSMAAPHVCGAAALHLSAGIDANVVSDLLINSATPNKVEDPGSGSPTRLLFLEQLSTTKAPTSTMSSAPTPATSSGTRAPSSSDSNPLSWDINMVKVSDGTNDEGKPTINILYESSYRDYQVEVFAGDCESATDVFSVSEKDIDSNREGYMNVDVTLSFDQDELEKSPLWDENGRLFLFCVSKSLLTGDIIVTQRNTIIQMSLDNQGDFSVNGIAVEGEDVLQENHSMTYTGTVTAFQCDENSYERVDGDTFLGPFDVLNVCVKVDEAESDVVVSGILNLNITQDITGVSFVALKNGETEDNLKDLVSTKCNGAGICMARVQLINAFFSDLQSLNVGGVATLGGTSRKLNLPVRTSLSLRGGGKAERNLQEDDEDNEFTLKVALAQPCKEGKGVTSILRDVIHMANRAISSVLP